MLQNPLKERGWKRIVTHLVPNETIVVIHGILKESCSFFVAHHQELDLLANPNARGKAFKYLGTKKEQKHKIVDNARVQQYPKLNFQENPGYYFFL